MTDKETGETTEKQILILCVDRDGDLNTKAEVQTPLIGRTANLEAAVSLSLKDPEEPDANAMYEAVRVYDRLQKEKKSGEVFEIATICGTEMGGVGADRKIVDELNSVLRSFDANEVILVTDGYTDEAVLPLVESRVPVSSVRRIVIKHSESIEETAQLFTKYLRMMVENPKYSRVALGVPGVLFILWVLCWKFEVTGYYYIAILVVLGAVFLIKGFGVDRYAKNFYKWAREYQPPSLPVQIANYAAIAGILCVGISIYSGYVTASAYVNGLNPTEVPIDFGGWLGKLPALSGYYLKGAIDLIVVGLATILLGRAIRLYFDHDARVLRNVALIVTTVWCRWIFDGAANVFITPGDYTGLILSIVVGILIAIASFLLILIINRSAKGFFDKSKTKVEELEESS